MKLSRSLFYTLVVIFLAGIVLTCATENASVWSRIATGLITGSFVGAINILVNYLHQRKEYFERVTNVMFELADEVVSDFMNQEARMEFLMVDSRQYVIEQEHKNLHDNMEMARKFGQKYESFRMKLDPTPYAPLFFFKNQRAKALEGLEDKVWMIQSSSTYLHCCFGIGLLGVKTSKEEQMMAIGDPETFYKDTMQHNVDFRDICVFNIHNLAEAYDAVGASMNGIVRKEFLELRKAMTIYLRHTIEGYEVKDVMTMRGEEVEKEMEERYGTGEEKDVLRIRS